MATTGLIEWVRKLSRRELFRTAPVQLEDVWSPRFRVHESYRAIRYVAEVPGVRGDDLQICIAGNRLIVCGHREGDPPLSKFTRYFTLPDTVDLDDVTSDLHDSVLTIVAPRKTSPRLRKVHVECGLLTR